MKLKKIDKKLSLNRTTISNLKNNEMRGIIGASNVSCKMACPESGETGTTGGGQTWYCTDLCSGDC
jgi:hypothetical protein